MADAPMPPAPSTPATVTATGPLTAPPDIDRRLRRPWRLAVPAALLVLTAATHWPRLAFGPEVAASDKSLHLLAFGGLTIILWATGWFRTPWRAGLAAFAWSVLDEVTQGLPGVNRTSGWSDVVANGLGCTLAVAWIVALRPVGGRVARWRHAVLATSLARVFRRRWPWWLAVVLFGLIAATYLVLRRVDVPVPAGRGIDRVALERWILSGVIIAVAHVWVLAVLRAWGRSMERARRHGLCTACGRSGPDGGGAESSELGSDAAIDAHADSDVHSDSDSDAEPAAEPDALAGPGPAGPAGSADPFAPLPAHRLDTCHGCGATIWSPATTILSPPRFRATLQAAQPAAVVGALVAVVVGGILLGGPYLLRAMIGTMLEPFAASVTGLLRDVPPALERSIDLAISGVVFAGLVRLVRRRLVRVYDDPAGCRTCGHDLRATEAPDGPGRCPECGEPFVRLSASTVVESMVEPAAEPPNDGDPDADDRFEHDARTVSGLTLASRVTGLARDAALARVFGAGGISDALLFAFMVPNLLRRLFGEGALAAAFLPVYTRLRQTSEAAGDALGRRVLVGMTATVTALVLLAEIGLLIAGWTGAVAPADPGAGAGPGLLARLTMIMLPYAPMVCTVAVAGAMLQVRGRFGPAAAAPLVLNAVMILALVGPARAWDEVPQRHAAFVALSVVVAGLIQVAWVLAVLRGGRRRRPATSGTSPAAAPVPADLDAVRAGTRDVARHVGPMILGLGVLQLGTLLDGLIASWPMAVGPTIAGRPYPLELGAMTAINFAQRLYQFPLGVFGIAIATAIFPLLARRAAAGDVPGLAAAVRSGLRLTAFVGLPASVGLFLVREPLVATLFEGGDFTSADTLRTARVLAAYAAGVWAYSMVHVVTRAFYALESPRTPVRVALLTLSVNLAMNLGLIWTPLREAGLAVSTAAASVLQLVILLTLLTRRTGVILDRATLRSLLIAAGIAAAMGTAVWGVGRGLPDLGAPLRLAALVATGMVTFGGLAAILRVPELPRLLGRRAAD